MYSLMIRFKKLKFVIKDKLINDSWPKIYPPYFQDLWEHWNRILHKILIEGSTQDWKKSRETENIYKNKFI